LALFYVKLKSDKLYSYSTFCENFVWSKDMGHLRWYWCGPSRTGMGGNSSDRHRINIFIVTSL